jgi:hypothetical protein
VATDFPAIQPGATDDLTMDFTKGVGSSAITAAVWTCSVSPESPVIDATPSAHLLGVPTWLGGTTTQRFTNGVEGVIYRLSVTAVLADGRVLVDQADMSCVAGIVDIVPVVPLTVEQFRATFPAFANTNYYPDEQVAFWIDEAVGGTSGSPAIDPLRWGQFYNVGLRLYVAHNLALERLATRQSASGAAPVGSGVVSGRSVGPASVSYDTEFGSEEGGGNYNLTVYGQRFLRYLRMAGTAPAQL